MAMFVLLGYDTAGPVHLLMDLSLRQLALTPLKAPL